jgi:hypothetical protein
MQRKRAVVDPDTFKNTMQHTRTMRSHVKRGKKKKNSLTATGNNLQMAAAFFTMILFHGFRRVIAHENPHTPF